MARKAEVPIYQLKITLYQSKPPIWRRVLVPGNITLDELHLVIQIVMGWDDYHLHQFIMDEKYYSDSAVAPDRYDEEMYNEDDMTLMHLVPGEKFKFHYGTILGMAGCTTSWSRRFCRPIRNNNCRCVSKGCAPARQRTWGASGATTTFWQRSKTPITPDTKTVWHGLVGSGTQKRSI